jgi:hypothetical protein
MLAGLSRAGREAALVAVVECGAPEWPQAPTDAANMSSANLRLNWTRATATDNT